MRGKGWIVAVALAFAALPTPARAVDLNALWPDLGLPGFKITPFLSERIEYESNVFQVASGAQGSTIFKTIPGFTLELPFGRHRFDLGFRTEILRYVSLGSQNTENYFVLARAAFDFPGAWLYSEGRPVLHLNDISPTDQPQRPDSGVIDHVAFGSRGFEAMKRHLAQKGVSFRVNEVPNSSRRQIFVNDPNNVLIELNFDVANESAAT